MPFDIPTFGEALVEVMRTGIDQPLNTPVIFDVADLIVIMPRGQKVVQSMVGALGDFPENRSA